MAVRERREPLVQCVERERLDQRRERERVAREPGVATIGLGDPRRRRPVGEHREGQRDSPVRAHERRLSNRSQYPGYGRVPAVVDANGLAERRLCAEQPARSVGGQHDAAGRGERGACVAGNELEVEQVEELGVGVRRVDQRLVIAGGDDHVEDARCARQVLELRHFLAQIAPQWRGAQHARDRRLAHGLEAQVDHDHSVRPRRLGVAGPPVGRDAVGRDEAGEADGQSRHVRERRERRRAAASQCDGEMVRDHAAFRVALL